MSMIIFNDVRYIFWEKTGNQIGHINSIKYKFTSYNHKNIISVFFKQNCICDASCIINTYCITNK